MQSRRIIELAAIISKDTIVADNYFTSHDLPTPSFDISGPTRIFIPPQEKDVAAAHLRVIGATKELHNLMLGPTAALINITPNETLSLQCIYSYKIAASFPVGQETTFESISETVGLNVIDTRRMLRYAMTCNVFREPRPGVVAHTAASKLIAEDPLVRDLVGIHSEERFLAAAHTVEAMKKYGFAKEPNQWVSINVSCSSENTVVNILRGFSVGHETYKGFYEELRDHPDRGRRWAGAMSAFASKIPLEPLLNGYDWAGLGSATVVDVGGGYGPVSIGLAKQFPNLHFIVQDFEDVVAGGPKHVPAEISDRITFMGYDMMTTQPSKDADIYFFRAIFHNWTDFYCVKILKNQIPALKKGARLVINDSCLHEPGTLPSYTERKRRSMDLNMLEYFGSRERTLADWEAMLKEADESFELKSAVKPPGGQSYILEVVWNA